MQRTAYLNRIKRAFQIHPIVAILGPRQCGKTTLARNFFDSQPSKARKKDNYFDLEDPKDLAKLREPKLNLESLKGLIVIDEIQRRPNLFPLLRVLVDRRPNPSKFLILGSASRDLIRQSSESLAGRIAHIELTPFNLREIGERHLDKLWLYGGFPKSYLASQANRSWEWRKNYITTFLEKDIPNLGIQIPPQTLRRFWLMLTHYHGNIFNASEIGRSLGAADTTVRRYLDILSGTFMIRQLCPWYENINKRQVKSVKIFFRDSGILHSLLDIKTISDLRNSPKLGASWEGFAFEEVTRRLEVRSEEIFFWGTYQQAEIDLMLMRNGKRIGFEFKYTDAPRVTKSIKIAMKDLKLSSVKIIYPGHETFMLDHNIEAIGLKKISKLTL